jgi:TPR repeat protein
MFDLSNTSQAQKIFAHVYKTPRYVESTSPLLRKLIGNMVQKLPRNRPDIDTLRAYIESRDVPEPTVDKLRDFPGELSKTLPIYRQLASDEIAYGCYKMGYFYEKGHHVERDSDAAIANYERALALGYAPAKNRLAKLIPG